MNIDPDYSGMETPGTKSEMLPTRQATGIELIGLERIRQLTVEDYSDNHDDRHTTGDLIDAAMCYATVAATQVAGGSSKEWPVELFDGFHDSIIQWPWDEDDYKPAKDALQNLVKSGALIAAEIDRLLRLSDGVANTVNAFTRNTL